jgi:hypothetical protein
MSAGDVDALDAGLVEVGLVAARVVAMAEALRAAMEATAAPPEPSTAYERCADVQARRRAMRAVREDTP